MTNEAIIELEEVDAGYGPDAVILEGINLRFERGEITALLGGSGSGKSTLLRTIIGLLPPVSGQVRMFGEDLYAMEEEERARFMRRVGMLFQYGALFGSSTIFENVALPLREHTKLPEPVVREMVRMKLALVGLDGLESRLPSDVSGGQAKRVALARATILDPELIFCDEPSAGLDPVVGAGLDGLLRQFQKLFGMSMVVITHELESIKVVADRVIMIDDGAILAAGTVDELKDSEDERVYNFFHRVAPGYASGSSGGMFEKVTADWKR